MTELTLPDWPRVQGAPQHSAVIRSQFEDFQVEECLGFELEGEGEHCWIEVEKAGLNTAELVQQIAQLAGVRRMDVGFAGLKDRNAVTRQWFSVQLPGQPDPDWALLESTKVRVLKSTRHPRKLRRGVHRSNRFSLRLTDFQGSLEQMGERLAPIGSVGVPNYFGGQRFGRNGSTLRQALQWSREGGPKVDRSRRGLYFSVLRSLLFNTLLAKRVETGVWNRIGAGEVCMLRGSRSMFVCEQDTPEIQERLRSGDLSPGLPLWGRGKRPGSEDFLMWQDEVLTQWKQVAEFLVARQVDLAHRPARLVPDDFSWEFCDDGAMHLTFTLPVGSFATAVLREVVDYREGHGNSGGNGGGE